MIKLDKDNINKYINYTIVLYAFSLPLSKAGVVFSELLMIVLWIIEGDFHRKFDLLKKSKFIITIFVLILFSFISILWSSDKVFALLYIKKYWHFLVIPVIFTSLQYKYIRAIFSSFLSGMLISEFISYGIFFEFIHIKGKSPSDPAPFMDHTNYSVYLSFTAMILLNRFFHISQYKYKIFYGLYFLLVTSNLFLNGGRTGQIIFIITIFIISFLNIQNKLKAFFITVVAIGSIIFTAYMISPNFKNRVNSAAEDLSFVIKKGDFSHDFALRPSLWIMGANVFKDNIIYGTGIGDERVGMEKYADKYKFTRYQNNIKDGYIDYHNAYIQYGVQLGIFGFLLYILIWYFLWKNKFTSKYYKNINTAFVITMMMLSFVGPTLHLMLSMTFFASFSSILSAISRLELSHRSLVGI